MSNRTIEAVLQISSKLGSMAAFSKVASQLKNVSRQSEAFNRAQRAQARAMEMSAATVARYAAPGLIAYGAKQAFTQFAQVERQLSRTGIKLGATRDEMNGFYSDLTRSANKLAILPDAAVETADAYAETGATLGEIRSDIEGLLKAQQGLGAGGSEIVSTWDAARRSFGLMTKDAEAFFDRVATGGAAGKFEGSDLARYLPSLMPLASQNGFSGLEGTERLIGALETMRNYVGTSEEAATATQDFFDKINSPTVNAAFKKVGVNLPKALKDAKRDGKDVFKVMADLVNKVTKGDPAKIGNLFGDRDSRRFITMLATHMDELDESIGRIRNDSKGMISNNVSRVLDDAQAKVDQLSGKWSTFITKVGGNVVAPIATPILDNIERNLDREELITSQLAREGKGFLSRNARLGYTKADDDAVIVRAHDYDAQMQYQNSRFAGETGLVGGDLPQLPPGQKQKPQKLPKSIPLPGWRPSSPKTNSEILADIVSQQDFDRDFAHQDAPFQLRGLEEDRTTRDRSTRDLATGPQVADTTDNLLRAANAGPDPEALRSALEQAGQSIETSGAAAGQSIAGSVDGMAATLTAAIQQACASGAGVIGSSIRASLAGGTTIQFNGSPAMRVGGGVSGNVGRSSPSAAPASSTPWGGPR